MIEGGNWWRANEIIMRHLTRRLETRYPCRDKAIARAARRASRAFANAIHLLGHRHRRVRRPLPHRPCHASVRRIAISRPDEHSTGRGTKLILDERRSPQLREGAS